MLRGPPARVFSRLEAGVSENIVWRVTDCAYCEKPIDGEEAESGRFVQHFGNEGDYYFHRA